VSGDRYVPSAGTRCHDGEAMDEMVRRARRAVSALDGVQRLRLAAMLANRSEWRREKQRWESGGRRGR